MGQPYTSQVPGTASAVEVASLGELWGLFPPGPIGPLPGWCEVEGQSLPEPQKKLLVHQGHMTIALNEHHRSPVQLQVLDRRRWDEVYARRLVLTIPGKQSPVLFGIMRIDLTATPPEAREEILSESKPLGAILIDHGVLRRIESRHYLELRPGPLLAGKCGIAAGAPLYGRLATIYCGGRAAVELLEVVIV